MLGVGVEFGGVWGLVASSLRCCVLGCDLWGDYCGVMCRVCGWLDVVCGLWYVRTI